MMSYVSIAIDVALWGFMALTAYLVLAKVRELYLGGEIRGHLAHGLAGDELDDLMERLDSGMALLAVTASTAAFVGLSGTVVHIIDALKSMTGGGLDMGVISGPIAVALYATLKGLASAIPAAAAYTIFGRRLQSLEFRLLRQSERRVSLKGADHESR